MSMTKHELENKARLMKMINRIPVGDQISGWRRLGQYAVGGLLEVGFSRHQEMLLVISSQGQGVFDCKTGEKIFRCYDESDDNASAQVLKSLGVGPLAGEVIDLAGIYGGGLPTINNDGDSLVSIAPHWPRTEIIFCGQRCSIYNENTCKQCTIIASDYEVRAYGFSWQGNVLICATSDGFALYRKKDKG